MSLLMRVLSDAFATVPDSTNAVESNNRYSKGSKPDILKVALMSTYKVDMVAALEHLAASQGIQTAYEDLNLEARAKRSEAANKRWERKRARNFLEEDDGPADKKKHLLKGIK